MKKILIFSYAYSPLVGGAEIAVQEITKRLPALSFAMVTRRFSRAHARREAVGAVSVMRVGGGKFFFPLCAAWRASVLNRKNRYDAVWAIMANRAGLAALCFKLFHPRTPFILTLQEGDPLRDIMRKVGVFHPLFKMIFRSARTVTAISSFLARWAQKMGAKNVVVVPNGVDLQTFQNAKTQNIPLRGISRRETKTIITVSRLVPKNGIADLIAAMQYLPPQYRLVIVGSGPLRDALASHMTRLALPERVHFVGSVPYAEVPKYLAAADIFCRPSLSEGFGNSFIEAMAAGVPVIATPAGGITDFLFDSQSARLNLESEERFNLFGQTGLFCKVHNPKSIADAVLLLDQQPALREAIISSARRMVEQKYDWNLVAKQMKGVFERL